MVSNMENSRPHTTWYSLEVECGRFVKKSTMLFISLGECHYTRRNWITMVTRERKFFHRVIRIGIHTLCMKHIATLTFPQCVNILLKFHSYFSILSTFSDRKLFLTYPSAVLEAEETFKNSGRQTEEGAIFLLPIITLKVGEGETQPSCQNQQHPFM